MRDKTREGVRLSAPVSRLESLAARLGLTAALVLSHPVMPAQAPRIPPPSDESFRLVETFALDDGRQVETVELSGLKCFQPNSQFPPTSDGDQKFVNGEWGNHEFVFVHPVTDPSGPIPLFLHLRGGGFAWVDTSIPAEQIGPREHGVSWGKIRGPGLHFNFGLLSTQWWTRKHAYSALTFDPLPEVPSQRGSRESFISQLRERFPEWGILYPSYCSRDAYVGRGEVGPDAQRFGYLALIRALDYVEGKYGIDSLFVGGTSAGGLGAAVIARDLNEDRPDLPLLGAIVDSGPAEGAAFARLNDDGVVNGLRRITLDDGSQAWIACDHPLQDMHRGLQAIDFLDFSLSRAIEEDRIHVPLLHAYQRRDISTTCADLDFSQRFLDGPIARAIEKHNPGGASVNYELCEGTTPACADEEPTRVDQCEHVVQVPCSKHGVLGRGPKVADALDWMERVLVRARSEPSTDPSP